MSPHDRLQRIALSLIGGVVAGTLAFILVFLVTRGAASDWLILVICAPLGTFVVATVGFWLLLGLGHRLRVWMGVVAGLILGVWAHAATWYLAIVAANLFGVRSSLGDAPVDLLNGLWACWVYAAGSLFLVGWVSVPVSAIAGGVFVFFSKSRLRAEV